MILRRKFASTVIAVSLAVTTGVFGSIEAAGASTAGSGGAPAAAASSPAPIKFGFLCSCSGAGGFGAFILPAKKVLQAWVDTVNKSGGIAGHKVKLIVEDDGGNPGTAVTNAKTLIADHVVAVATSSVADTAFASALTAAKIPVVGIEPNNGPFGTNPDFFPEGQTNVSSVYSVLTTAKRAGAKNLANVYCAESPDCAQSVPVFQSTGKKLGIPVTYDAEIAATAPNYTAQCVAAKQQGVQSVFIGDASAVIDHFATDCAVQGYTPTYVTEGAGFGVTMVSAKGLKDHLWTAFPTMPYFATTSVVKKADAVINKKDPGLAKTATYGQLPFMAWISGVLLETAIKAGGLTAKKAPSATEVLKGLYSLKGNTLGGLTVPLTFTKGKPHNITCWFTTRIQNGVPKLVSTKDTCDKTAP